ncbi:hypothetical protein ACJRO7_009982 [Eucalyptus globulus]|uniref:non-specific serine/threonine protein kinase n=1 Tax=Eucalyptus globulus TaxID=34317 RepID=A0ABD3LBB8_EUCGL
MSLSWVPSPSSARILHFLFPLFLILIKSPPSLGVDYYSSCNGTFSCGDVGGIGYPFWGGNRASFCGYPELELKCENGGNTTIVIQGVKYRVLEVYPNSTQVLRIARDDYMQGICPTNFLNTTLDPSMFQIAEGYTNVTFLYGCQSVSPTFLGQFSCPFKGVPYTEGYVFSGSSVDSGACFKSVVVPVSSYSLSDLGNSSSSYSQSDLGNSSSSYSQSDLGNSSSSLSDLLQHGFEVQLKVDSEACVECTQSNGVCGYNSTANRTTCSCPDQSFASKTCGSSTSAETPEATTATSTQGKRNVGLKIGIGIAASGAGIGIALILMLSCMKKPMIRKIADFIKQWSEHFDDEVKIEGLVSSRRYTYKDIKKMTNSFEEKLGEGGYGCVYKGKLSDGQLVAVKLLKKLKGDAEEFFNEVASISKTSHVNVVSLLGFCFKGSKRALVYEFMPNGSLEKFIFNRNNSLEADQQLSWDTLYRISLGIAHGLEYLHKGCNTRILHFDIKPHNILLDGNYCPKISDFGLAKICPREESIVSMLGARGTIGYIAPELILRNIGGVSHKSDVYSYGMMVLEIVGKRRNIEVMVDRSSEIYFPHWIHQRLELQEDLGLCGVMNEEDKGIAKKMIVIGLWCIQIDPRARPSMTQVVKMLEGSVEVLQIPPRPIWSSPPRSLAACLAESSSLQNCDDSS